MLKLVIPRVAYGLDFGSQDVLFEFDEASDLTYFRLIIFIELVSNLC